MIYKTKIIINPYKQNLVKIILQITLISLVYAKISLYHCALRTKNHWELHDSNRFPPCVKFWQDKKRICIFVSFLADKEAEIKGRTFIAYVFNIKLGRKQTGPYCVLLTTKYILSRSLNEFPEAHIFRLRLVVTSFHWTLIDL